MKKMAILLILVFLFAFIFVLANTKPAIAKYKIAKICKDCHRTNNGIKCLKCGKVSTNEADYLTAKCCKSCAEKRKCTQCGKKFKPFSPTYRAYFCRDCIESVKVDGKYDKCVQCGETIYPER